MEDTSSDPNQRDSWTDRAVQYAEDYGWQIVPLQANSKSSPQYSEDPIERQLSAFIPIDYEADATADPDEIEHLGVQFPVALIGARTGSDSNLLAVEISHRNIEPGLRDQIDDLAGDAPRVLGTNREYVLFTYPQTDDPPPPMTRMGGAVLHGDGSVIQLPWRYYRWSLHPRELGPPSTELLALFEGHDSQEGSADAAEPRRSGENAEPTELDNTPDVEAPVDADDPASPVESETTDADSLFRTGPQLQNAAPGPRATPNTPWATSGGLTLVVGRPKTSGKSTWVLNLAAHRAAGEPFLGTDADRTDVVLLVDGPPGSVGDYLEHLDFVDEATRSHLHVVHPTDVAELTWDETLTRAYQRAEAVGAQWIVIDSLDIYVRLKSGEDPTTNEAVVRGLTTDAPDDCALLAVTSVERSGETSMSETVEDLGLLGIAADGIIRLENVATDTHPTLRRLHSIGRSPHMASTLYVELSGGRLTTVPADEVE